MNLSFDGKAIGSVQVGIPLPAKSAGGKASPERRAIEALEAGQSRTFTGYPSRTLVFHCASIRKKFPDRKFAVRSMGKGSPVVRVWRTE